MNEAIARNVGAFEALSASPEEEAGALRWQEEKVGRIEAVLRSLPRRERLADVGCFTGYFTPRYFGAGVREVHGFDQSPEALARAAGRGVRAARWAIESEPCPAPDAFFDVVVAADVIEHLVSTDRFVAELRRIVRPDGRVLVTTPNLGFWWSRLRLLFGRVPWSYPGPSSTVRGDPMVDLNHIRVHLASEWAALFEAGGLRVERLEGWSILEAIDDRSFRGRARRWVDRLLSRRATLAFGLLFVLEASDVRER